MANKLADRPGKAIAVIGDGAMSAGMAYEAMNNAKAAGNRLIVILNDNDMSIAPPVGGLSHYLARLVSSGKYLTLRRFAQRFARKLPKRLHVMARRWGNSRGFCRGTSSRSWLLYVCRRRPRIEALSTLENVRDADEAVWPVVTNKAGLCARRGRGRQYHGSSSSRGDGAEKGRAAPSRLQLFGDTRRSCRELPLRDPAAIPSATGFDASPPRSRRAFDVASPSAAVTFAGAGGAWDAFLRDLSTFCSAPTKSGALVAIRICRSASLAAAGLARRRQTLPEARPRLPLPIAHSRVAGGREAELAPW